jgi:type I restriction enzyme S subunit
MIDGLKPYPKMKDSGVPWLGKVPEHWEVLPNRAICTEVNCRNHPGAQMLSVTITKGVIRQRALLADSAKKDSSNLDRSAYKLVRCGDIAYNKMRAWQGAIGASDYEGIVSPAYVIQRPRNGLLSRYLHFLFRTPAFAKEAERWSYGITSDMWSLRPEHFKLIYSCVPPAFEQAAIATFLDHADRRIRQSIRAKQKLVKLLEEQKQTIIQQAVTRGLNPDVRLKPSGVAWLGSVPEHWEVVRSKRVFVPRTELAQPDDIQLSATQAFGVISQAEYERRVGRKIVKIFRHLEKRKHVEPDDFVISMRSFQGGLERAWERGCIRSSYVVLRQLRGVSVPYFAKLFKSAGYIRALQSTADFIRDGQDLNYENFCAVDLPFPPIGEQSQIAAAVDRAVMRASVLGDRTRQEITLLEELRTGIISDVVTGKVDVQEIASRLPPESIDAANEYGDGDTDSCVTDEDFEGEVDDDAQEVANDD